jgi:hypothetical protein
VTRVIGDPNGLVDSAADWEAQLEVGDRWLHRGTYLCGLVTYEGSEDRTIRALPGHKVTIIQTDIDGVFSLRGGWDELGAISSIASGNVDGNDDGTTQTYVSLLTMSGATSVTKGDIVKVVSDDAPVGYATAEAGQETRRGEYSMVALTSSSTTVSLGNQLIDTYTTTPRLARLWDTKFTIEGDITFTSDPLLIDDTGYSASVEIRAAKYCVIDGLSFEDCPGRGIANYTYAASIRNCRFKNMSNRPSLSHFGYGIQDGGHATRIDNVHGENLRHLVTENANNVDESSDYFEYYGGGRFGLVTNSTGSNCQAAAFDTHETAYGYTFEGCKAFGTFIGASSGGNGFTLRGRKCRAVDCEAHACWVGYIIATYDGAELDNCKSLDTTYQAILLTVTSDDVAITSQTNVYVHGGIYEASRNTSTRIVQVADSTAATLPAVVRFKDVRFRMIGTQGNGSMVFDIYDTSKVALDDCEFDLTGWGGGTTSLQLIVMRDTGAQLNAKNLKIVSIADVAPTLCVGNAAANASRVRFYNYDYEYTGANSRALTVTNGNLTDYKVSGVQRYGTSWFEKNRSSSNTMVASAGASLAAYGNLLDDHIYIRLTGSNGAVALGSMPTAEFQGQRYTFINKSNGAVTVNSQAIAVDGTATFAFGLGANSYYLENLHTP